MRRSTRSLTLALATAAVSAVLLSGCAPDGGGDGGHEDASVTVGLVLAPDNLNIRATSGAALEQVLIDNVYEGLVSRTPDGEIVPSLAESWDVSDDGLEYTFHLAEGVTFHSGNDMTVDDVVWSLTQVKDDASLVEHGNLSLVETIEAADESTVTITLSSPDANLLWNLSSRAGLVLEEQATNDLATSANGTGPFTLAEWKQGDSITLARYDDYWGEAAKVDEVVLAYIPDFTAAVNAVIAGDVDVQVSVDANLRSQIDELDDVTLVEGRTTDKFTLAFNNQRAPFDDVRVREALRLAIDHNAIIEAIGGAGSEIGGPIPELDPGYEDLTGTREFDPDRARALLAEAGHPSLELTLTIPSFYGTTVSSILVSQFHDVGVTLNVNNVEFATWLNDVYTNKDYDLSYVDHVEARDFGNWANPDYYFGYDNAEVQALYAESVSAVDPGVADEKLREAARIVAEDHAADWLYNATTLTAVREGITGFPTDSLNARIDLGQLAAE
ncbi:ABC transporter substrate-binding protein [Okibacterium endophyticum]